MDLRELTEAMHAFVTAKGWYAANSRRPQTPRNLAASLSIEAAEVLEHFQWGEAAATPELAGELADVALYLLQLASLSGIDLEQAILDKLRLNYARTWDTLPAAPGPAGDEPAGQEAAGRDPE
jgi:NTP pyrophosphatase (non-canonical NTP hydrolase)